MSFWGRLLFLVALVLWGCVTHAAVSRHIGPCLHKGSLFAPGQTFRKDCDKCYCHQDGFVCLSPMKPTAWPKKCKRISTDCGYHVVYIENPTVECRPYSWIW